MRKKKEVDVIKLVINIAGKEVTLTLDEAKKLYTMFNEIFAVSWSPISTQSITVTGSKSSPELN